MTSNNRKKYLSRDPQPTVECDPQMSNLQHAVEYSKYGVFQIKNIPEFYHSKEEQFVKQLMQICFSKLSF